MTACKWAGSGNPRILPGRHDADCPQNGAETGLERPNGVEAGLEACPGCLACPEAHCYGDACRGRNHAETICEECITAVRDDLDAVVTLYARLRSEAIAVGTRGDRTDAVLGGDAMVMLAMTYPDQTGSRAESHEHERKNDPVPPLVTLAGWEDIYREHLEQPTDLTATVERAAAYLDRQMHHMAATTDVPFDEFAREVRQLRTRMEDVLHDGEREETGAPCPMCDRALVKKYGRTEAFDRWVCPSRRCGEWYLDHEYRRWVSSDYRANADALTAPDIEAQYEVSAGSVRGWASKGEIRKRGKDASGRQLYDVADVLAKATRKAG